MEFKGTKGKWEVSIDNNKIILTDSGAYAPNAMHKTISTDTELIANALLISKAPEMLEMLQKVNDSLLNDYATLEQIKLRREIEKLIKEVTEI
jgi:hypothetical protein